MKIQIKNVKRQKRSIKYVVSLKGGVEDTRLEAKAKNTKKSEAKAKDTFPRTDTLKAKDRNARGQGQGPRTQAQVLSKKKKAFTKIFQ